MSTHEQGEFAPLIDPDESHSIESSARLIPSGQSQQAKLAKQLLEYHAEGSQYLTGSKEQKLQKIIQEGRIAADFLETLTEEERTANLQQVNQYEKAIEEGKKAQHILVESALKFASYYARASMNIVNLSKNKKMPTEDNEEEAQKPERIGTYADIRLLRSPYASLDDRIQLARLGLIEAAGRMEPRVSKKTKRHIGFLTFAAWRVHATLSKEAYRNEAAGGVILPQEVRQQINKSRKYPNEFTPNEHDQLLFASSLAYSEPYESFTINAPAYEEYENEHTGVPYLDPSDIIADLNNIDDNEREIMQAALKREVENILGNLRGENSEREAGIIRYRYGIPQPKTGDAQTSEVAPLPKSLEQIGVIYGITKERVRQIESKAMSKLRHPIVSERLRLFHEDSSNLSRLQNSSPYLLSDRVFGVVNIASTSSREWSRERLVADELTETPSSIIKKESWQITPDEEWDAPVKYELQNTTELEQETGRLLAAILKHVDPKDFRQSSNEVITYPADTFENIMTNCSAHLRPHHIEEYWNNHISQFVDTLHHSNKDTFDLTKVSLLFSALLSETMTDNDAVELEIPQVLNNRLDYFGAELKHGEVTIKGDLGNYAGYKMKDLANLKVQGSVGDYAAAFCSGLATLTIEDNAGKNFAYGAKNETSFSVKGVIKSLAIAPDFNGEITAGAIEKMNLAREKTAYNITIT